MITGSIVLYNNNIYDLKKVINSFLSSNHKVKLFLIDNSETDNLSDICKDQRIEYIFNNANVGFGKAHNTAIKLAEFENSDYHIVLNPDIYFDSNVVSELFEFMENNLDIGLTMPKVLYPNGDTQYVCKLLPTPFNLILRRFLPEFDFIRKMDYEFEMRFTNYEGIVDSPYLSGSFMFLRISVLKELGNFDENIFMYLEDTDLTRRINKKYRTVMNSNISIFHKWGKGSYKSKKLVWYHIKAAIYYFNKWGWFFDSERSRINTSIINNYKF